MFFSNVILLYSLLPFASQRLALAVVGRAETALKTEVPQARNLLENAARTHHPLHAVLGVFIARKTPCRNRIPPQT